MTYQRIQTSLQSIGADAKALDDALSIRTTERDALTAQVQALSASVAAKDDLLAQLATSLEAKDATLAQVIADRDAKSTEIAVLKSEIVTLKAEIVTLNAQIAALTPPPPPARGKTLFAAQVPANQNATDGTGAAGDYELGMRFTVNAPGVIQSIRYWKASQDTGSHTGRIWNQSTGALLASVTFANETASGWQEQALPTSLTVATGVTYVVSVNVTQFYALTLSGFGAPITANGITAPVAAGVYNVTPGQFPTTVAQNNNYFRDVVFLATGAVVTPPPVTPPPVTPPPVTPPPAGTLRGWQLTISNVGLAALGINGSQLPAYTGDYQVPAGSRISGVKFIYPVDLSKGDIIIERSIFQPTQIGTTGHIITTVDYNSGRALPKKVIIRDCEIDGSLLGAGQRGSASSTAFIGVADLQRNYFRSVGSGIALKITGTAFDALIENNYVDNLAAWGDPGGSGSHNSAFTIRDFRNSVRADRQALIRNNRFETDTPNNASASAFITGHDGRIANVVIEGNLLEGYGYNLWLTQGVNGYSNVSAIDNRFTPKQFGAKFNDSPGFSVWQDNFLFDPTKADGKGAVVA